MRLLYFATFLWLTLVTSNARALRILGLFTYNGKSHFIVHEKILKALAERGHQVDVVSHFPLEKPFPNYTQVVDLEGILPDLKNNLRYEAMTRNTVGKSMIPMLATTHGGDLCDLMDQPRFKELINNPPNDPRYDLLIVDVSFSS